VFGCRSGFRVQCATSMALLYLVTSQDKYGARAWKSFDWDTMNRLHQKGYISDPKSKAKSVAVSEEGLARARELFERLFAKQGDGQGRPDAEVA